jgi:hypothetical protein
MSQTHELKRVDGLLRQAIMDDTSGHVLIELADQLTAAARQVESSLDQPHTAEEQDALQQLADAIRTSDTVLQRLWTKVHNRPAPL